VPSPPLKTSDPLLLDIRGCPDHGDGIGLYELQNFAEWVRTRRLSTWLGAAPFLFELLLCIPMRSRTLFNTTDYEVEAQKVQVRFMNTDTSLYAAEDIARHVLKKHTACEADFHSSFNPEFVRRMPLEIDPKALAALTDDQLIADLSSPSIIATMQRLRAQPVRAEADYVSRALPAATRHSVVAEDDMVPVWVYRTANEGYQFRKTIHRVRHDMIIPARFAEDGLHV
jgi:hypothetical protein